MTFENVNTATQEKTTQSDTDSQYSAPKPTRKKRQPKHDFNDGRGRVPAHKHDNGGGWVEDTARVDDTVYVGSRSEVYNYARVFGLVRLEGRSSIFGHARVGGRVRLNKSARIYGSACVLDETRLSDYARIHGRARVLGSTGVFGWSSIADSACVVSTTLNAAAEIHGGALVINSHLNGYAANPQIRTENAGCVTITGNARVIGATCYNRVQISDHADVSGTTLTAVYVGRQDAVLIVRDHCRLDGTRLTALGDIGGTTFMKNVVFHYYDYLGENDTLQTITSRAGIFIDRSGNNYAAITNLLQTAGSITAAERQGFANQVGANVSPAQAIHTAGTPRIDYLRQPSQLRRVQPLEEVSV